MDKKICSKCNTEKDIVEFSFKRKDKGHRRADCKACNQTVTRQHYQNNKANYLSSNGISRAKKREKLKEFLSDKQCKDCGNRDSRVLEFDHITNNKLANVGNLLSRNYSWANILLEIDKCEIVCANCHRIRTSIQQGWNK